MGTKQAGGCRTPPGSQSNPISCFLVASGTADKSAITAHGCCFYTGVGPWLHQQLLIVLISLTSPHSPCSPTQGSYLGSDWGPELWFELCSGTGVLCSVAMNVLGHESHWSRLQCTQWLLPWLCVCLAAVDPPEPDLWFDFKPASSPWILQHSEFSAESALLGYCGWAGEAQCCQSVLANVLGISNADFNAVAEFPKSIDLAME